MVKLWHKKRGLITQMEGVNQRYPSNRGQIRLEEVNGFEANNNKNTKEQNRYRYGPTNNMGLQDLTH